MTRKLSAVALTVVLAPTVVWTVFNGLRGTGGQPLYDVAADYVVTTYWHLDLGTSPAYPGLYREITSVYSNADLPLIQAMVIETTILIVVANLFADLIQARLDPRVR